MQKITPFLWFDGKAEEAMQLSADGGEKSRCGWLKDKYGLSWQVVPAILTDLLQNADLGASTSVMKAMMQMEKLDIATLKQAAGRA